MLIVGTRGRSLGGIQGLVNSRNSFSKYCLQYSPVPVVVVRPDEQRKKKLAKRKHDPARQSYVTMLARNEGRHEVDSENSSLYEMETPLSADQEAHKVASALALPAKFDPLLKPIDPNDYLRPRGSIASLASPPAVERLQAEPDPTARRPSNATASTTGNESGEEESIEEDEEEPPEFEVMAGRQALESTHKKERLHAMEMGEAAALTLATKLGLNQAEEEEEESEEDQGRGEAAHKDI